MKKGLKYIKIKGVLKSRGEYVNTSGEFRPYEAVTIRDNEGDEVHFHTFTISKRMDEHLKFDCPTTFYILRHRDQDNKLFGMVYAMESEGKKIFYPDTAIPALKTTGLAFRRRQILIN